MQTKLRYQKHSKDAENYRGSTSMFGRKKKIKIEFDNRLRNLLLETKGEWEQAREIEKYLNDYDEEVLVQRKIAESKYFHLFKEAKERKLRVERE